MTFIRVNNLTKTYKTPAAALTVLENVSLDIPQGQFSLMLGPSGSGKSTFLNMITGIDKPTNGEVMVDGVKVSHKRNLTRWRGRNIGIVFQQFQLLPTLTVAENVIMPMDFCGVHKPSERRKIALELLDRFDIVEQADKTPDMLSGGQQQRVAIARALANKPPLVIGDEPTANLDRMSGKVVFDTFAQLANEGHTVLVVTHDREQAVDAGASLYTVHNGKVDETTPEEAAMRRTDELRKLTTQELKKLSTREMRRLELAES